MCVCVCFVMGLEFQPFSLSLTHTHARARTHTHTRTCQAPESKETPLHAAVRGAHVPVVETLLSFGADPYQPNAEGKSAHDLMQLAMDQDCKTQMLRLVDGAISVEEWRDGW